MEVVNATRRLRYPSTTGRGVPPDLEAKWAAFPPIPPTLTRPEYALEANLIGRDDSELEFYLACEQGVMGDVMRYVETTNPSCAMRQYGLEQASFGCQLGVARYLLENGASLHSNVFSRPVPPYELSEACIFDRIIWRNPDGNTNASGDIIPLLQVFIDAGWHPNKAWYGAAMDAPCVPFDIYTSIYRRPLLEFLLSHGVDPNLGRHGSRFYKPPFIATDSLDRESGHALDFAAQELSRDKVETLLAHGAQSGNAKMLHMLTWYYRKRELTFQYRARSCGSGAMRGRLSRETAPQSRLLMVDGVETDIKVKKAGAVALVIEDALIRRAEV
ncbi:uncharacterized protein DNG_09870 [Cephalotrichum gorgonifer]|uniref:Uncharacterized protein n=1 Tax=Cephalotrichum gorgonifer TaxID=2041049 RepID=A0AAE8N6I9_9PEZI|nr:uncharacterized protein DNG_09870 [Cephalotrichum gorgonifer]